LYNGFFQKLFCTVFEKKKYPKKPKPWRINLLLQLVHDGWLEISELITKKFGKTKDTEYRMMIDLLDNIVPATLDVYAKLFRSGAFEQYIETIFCIWTFFLRWNRKNYNKLPLAFLSDYFYWENSNHPFAKALRTSLVNFNDYFVENMHSRIRAQTHKHSSVESIIQQAFIIDSQKHESFAKTFSTNKRYPYTPAVLDYLNKKTSCFLIDHFYSIYKNLNTCEPVFKKRKLTQYKGPTLNGTVEIKLLPSGYHTAHPPKLDHCDHCDKRFDPNIPEDDGTVLICGHGYHYDCFENLERSCQHCVEFYKKGISDNVKAFIKRLEANSDILTTDELENDKGDDENDDENNNDQEPIDFNLNEEPIVNRMLINAKNIIN